MCCCDVYSPFVARVFKEILWGASSHHIYYRGYAGSPRKVSDYFGAHPKQIEVGTLGVFGINKHCHVYYRIGTREDPTSIGTHWQKLPGKLKSISPGKSVIWGVGAETSHIFYTKSITNNRGNLHLQWEKVENNLMLKQISASPGKILLPCMCKVQLKFDYTLELVGKFK